MERLMPQDPNRIGQYRLLGRLGEGGMGQVFLARSERGRTVAVKTIRAALAQEPDFRRRFAQEITAARRVGGRWTAPVLDADTEAATPWVATGYIAGPSLHEVVGRDFGPLPERSVRLLANGLAHALRDIHGAGLVHRDLKPSNVLLTIDGPRVIDFGIARALEMAPGEGVTRTGATVGSPGFMSPEQVRGQRLSPASDIFCLGSLLAYAATGRTPFGALDSGVHILMFRIAEEAPDLTGVPEELHRLISACLAKDPGSRASIDQLLAATAPDGSREPWLPGALVAQLGRHAVELLDSENPESRTDNPVIPPAAPADSARAGEAVGPTAADSGPTPPAPAPPLAPSWPSSASPQPRPAPVPSPYSQPSGAYRPAQPSIPSLGGFGPSPYGTGNQTTQPPSRPRRVVPIVSVIAVLVVMAILGVVVAIQATGGDGGDDTAVDEGYLGAWQGEYTTESGEVRELRFEIGQGAEGEIIGAAYTLSPRILCAYEVRLDTFTDTLAFTEQSNWSVPQDQIDETCRDNPTVQTLSLSPDGQEMQWTYNSQQATLTPAPAASEENVPTTLLGEWRDEWEDGENDIAGEDILTISQGSIGEPVLRYARTENGEPTCTWENHLVQTGDREITLGPDTLAETGEGANCEVYAGFRLWHEEGDDDTIKIVWLDEPDKDPAEYERND
ncbi:serine/threonine protein kinase [Streptomyces litchfieldiae]|uniref:Protein kinase n=1 Tax=Streptomyces litchfieldiae TaxID=3075543 RepID=A0ABU2MTQ5_9ACTN|nr:protein kinase [Streptomyces sp. DSM 44938]MDT0345022.1 protein kinase [Streptomyces sp. DSM 44938]